MESKEPNLDRLTPKLKLIIANKTYRILVWKAYWQKPETESSAIEEAFGEAYLPKNGKFI